jgi:hypothetical protein
MVTFMPRLLYHQGKITQYPLNKRLGGLQKTYAMKQGYIVYPFGN